ncbi:alpha,alpha-trehalase TreF [Sphingomonas sp. TDK1]|uniref:alpha,alpha-trehalase TreF n=1 Tax=Sphingomonas sp. TDK1 TaxID=453247 RepID=UPI0007D97D1B|nr:alpha,alpha-trehalase TreF [Sphingomonas sp. TDK1]OAN58583.1 trehalase [Sphingomonas sp. TDK1]
MIRRLLPLAALLCVAATDPEPQSPAQLFGPLFDAVQMAQVFPDGKTFVDAVPKEDPAAILAAYRKAMPQTREALKTFVEAHFTLPAAGNGAPASQEKLGLRAHVQALWPVLSRPAQPPEPGSSALPLPAPYVVPGGRFREIYYWDSYFTMLGLKVDGQQAMVEHMLDDFVSLIQRYGHIPNGTRSYYLSRAQPPFFALMLDLSDARDPAVLRTRLAALRSEYGYWMRGEGCVTATQPACEHVVRMADGSLLNRYWDARETPRDESYREDVNTAKTATGRPAAAVYRDLRAGAESGWDYSSRWLSDGKTLATVHTTDIVPVDLNSLIWAMERGIAQRCATLGDRGCAADFTARAARRHAAIDRYLWLGAQQRYADYDWRQQHATPVLSAATLFPLFVGTASGAQANAVAATVRARLMAPGGLRTTGNRTGQQWDTPNGWAPLQWVAIDGLAGYGQRDLARDLAERWLTVVDGAYRATGKMLEKYDVEEQVPGGGGEYPLQDGFGWTNGVASALLERYPALAKDR